MRYTQEKLCAHLRPVAPAPLLPHGMLHCLFTVHGSLVVGAAGEVVHQRLLFQLLHVWEIYARHMVNVTYIHARLTPSLALHMPRQTPFTAPAHT